MIDLLVDWLVVEQMKLYPIVLMIAKGMLVVKLMMSISMVKMVLWVD